MDIPIIYEDDFFIVIDKPAGIVVNRSDNDKEGTIQDWVEARFKLQPQTGDFYNRAGIVHRLDKETSGLLLIAKNPQVFKDLQGQFYQRQVVKKYQALVHGKLLPREGEITVPVGRLPWNRRKFGILPNGKEAETSYRVIAHFKSEDKFYSLLEVTPRTGRTHQIRIHLKYLGYSIVGDDLYGGRKIIKEDRTICPRLFLQATYLSFHHPVTSKVLKFELKLAKSLDDVLKNLKVL